MPGLFFVMAARLKVASVSLVRKTRGPRQANVTD